MNKEELIEIKNTYDNAGYFMLYVDEVNFDEKLEKKLLRDGIYAVNDFESKFIKEQYAETEQPIAELKMFLEFLIQDMSNNVLSANGRPLEDLIESFSALLSADKLALRNLALSRYENHELLKTLVSRHYKINNPENKTELEAFLKYIDEKHAELLNSNK